MRTIICILGFTIFLAYLPGCVVPVHDDHGGFEHHDDHHDDHDFHDDHHDDQH